MKAGGGNDTHRSPCTSNTGNRWCGLTSLLRREHCEVAKWAPCVSPIHSLANPRDLKNGSRTVQSIALETPPHASPPQCSRLPVWPSPRRPWPQPRSVQQGWGVGQKGVRCRKCCRSDLQGKRRASVHQRHVAGLGHFPSTQLRRTTFGSGGRRVVFVRRVPACFGCYRCFHAPKADVEDGVALKEARRSKKTTYTELCRGDGKARLVVIAGKIGGRWSQETKDFLWCLACEKSKSFPRLWEVSVRVGWYKRWCCCLACSTA